LIHKALPVLNSSGQKMVKGATGVVGDGLVKDHGETVVRPRPGPRVNSMIVTPKAANAPPNIDAHSTADAELSTDFSATGAAVSSSVAIN
jgi:hypothetical protein